VTGLSGQVAHHDPPPVQVSFFVTVASTSVMHILVHHSWDVQTGQIKPLTLFHNGRYDTISTTWFADVGTSLVYSCAIVALVEAWSVPWRWGSWRYPALRCSRRPRTQAQLDATGRLEFSIGMRTGTMSGLLATTIVFSGGLPILLLVGAVACCAVYASDKAAILRLYTANTSTASSGAPTFLLRVLVVSVFARFLVSSWTVMNLVAVSSAALPGTDLQTSMTYPVVWFLLRLIALVGDRGPGSLPRFFFWRQDVSSGAGRYTDAFIILVVLWLLIPRLIRAAAAWTSPRLQPIGRIARCLLPPPHQAPVLRDVWHHRSTHAAIPASGGTGGPGSPPASPGTVHISSGDAVTGVDLLAGDPSTCESGRQPAPFPAMGLDAPEGSAYSTRHHPHYATWHAWHEEASAHAGDPPEVASARLRRWALACAQESPYGSLSPSRPAPA
jgi:hypothetical protein